MRFSLAQGFFIAVIISLLALALYFPVRQRMVSITNSSYEILAYTLAPSIYDSFNSENYEEVANIVHRVDVQRGVKYVLVIKADGTVFYDTISGESSLEKKTFAPDEISKSAKLQKGDVEVGRVKRDGVSYYNYVAPFIKDNRIAYTVRLGVDQEVIDGEFYQLARLFMYLGAFGIFVGIIAAYMLVARLTKPIILLTESALAIRAGNLNAYPDISTNDELEQLSREFQNMVEKLKAYYFNEYNQKKEALNAKKRLEEINTRLQELDRQKSDFLNAASHQLRTPLSVIHWSLSMIVDEALHMNLKPEQKELLEESLKSTRRMVDLVNELLDISRIEQGRKQLSWAKGNFASVCEELVKALQPLAQKKNLELTLDKEGDMPDSFIDEKAIYQVINNFVDNAIKYTAEGYVKVTCRHEGKNAEIEIKDSGIGMTEVEQKDLFTRFSRGSEAEKMFPNGSGLGMFVAKTMLKQHGGEIKLESEKGKGTTFTLVLPLYNDISEVPQASDQEVLDVVPAEEVKYESPEEARKALQSTESMQVTKGMIKDMFEMDKTPAKAKKDG